MGQNRANDSNKDHLRSQIPDEVIDAVARSIYGEAEYDALKKDSQVKDRYRKSAQALLTIACEGSADARARINAQTPESVVTSAREDGPSAPPQETGH